MNFKTSINAKDINFNHTVEENIYLKWSARIVASASHISDIVVSVPEQDIELTWIEYDEENDEEKEVSGIITIKNVEIEYDRDDASSDRTLGLIPVELTINKNGATVRFCAHSV